MRAAAKIVVVKEMCRPPISLIHGLAEPHFPISPETENGSSAVVSTFGTIRIANHGGKDPVNGHGPSSECDGHGEKRGKEVDEQKTREAFALFGCARVDCAELEAVRAGEQGTEFVGEGLAAGRKES